MDNTLPKVCSNTDCKSTQLSWFTHANVFGIGCDECSETVHIADPQDIVSRLNDLDYPRN